MLVEQRFQLFDVLQDQVANNEIGGLIRSVQDESDNAVGAIEEGTRSVASGVELSAEAVRGGETIVVRPGERIPLDGSIELTHRCNLRCAFCIAELIFAISMAPFSAGPATAARTAMMLIVVSSSISVNPVAW